MRDLSIILPILVTGCEFRLSSSVPPHTLLEWRGPGNQPSQKAIDAVEMPVIIKDKKPKEFFEELDLRLKKLEAKTS
jgi:hypothetical protein